EAYDLHQGLAHFAIGDGEAHLAVGRCEHLRDRFAPAREIDVAVNVAYGGALGHLHGRREALQLELAYLRAYLRERRRRTGIDVDRGRELSAACPETQRIQGQHAVLEDQVAGEVVQRNLRRVHEALAAEADVRVHPAPQVGLERQVGQHALALRHGLGRLPLVHPDDWTQVGEVEQLGA